MLQFTNHAGFLLHTAGARVLVDPWFSGLAFADGWALVSAQPSDEAVLRLEPSHIVYTHEHPDHFSIAFLKAVPVERRATITVVFQSTRDGKLLRFCAALGYATLALPAGRRHALACDLDLQIEPFDKIDSCLFFRARSEGREFTLLDANDCEFMSDGHLAEYARRFDLKAAGIDLLLTQFSYSSWNGNPEDHAERAAAARDKLRRVVAQVRAFKPRLLVPFASFVRFAHVENAFNNDGANLAGPTAECLRKELAVPVRFLQPLESLALDADHDPVAARAAERFWDRAWADGTAQTKVDAPVLPDELLRLSRDYAAANRVFLAGRGRRVGWYNSCTLPTLRVELSDHEGLAFELHALRGLGSPVGHSAGATRPALLISSSALAQVFHSGYGWDAVHVAGRYQVRPRSYQAVVDRALFLGLYRHNEVTGKDMWHRIQRSWVLRLARRAGGLRLQRWMAARCDRLLSHQVARGA